MNYKKVSSTIKGIVDKTLNSELAEHIIQKTDYGFNVYNKFNLSESDGLWIVNTDIVFSSSKAALTWCIYANKYDHKSASAVHLVDYKLSAKQFDIDMLVHRLETANSDDADIIRSILTEDTDVRRRLRKELSKLIEVAKRLKLGK